MNIMNENGSAALITLKNSVKAYEENNHEMIEELEKNEFYCIAYFGDNTDDAFEGGVEHGKYLSMVNTIELLES